MPRRSKRKGKGGARNPVANDVVTVNISRNASAVLTQFPKDDYQRRQRNWLLTETPPKSISNQIVWIRGTAALAASLGISNSAPFESNYSFNFANLTDLSGLTGYFDQYCIYSVVVTISCNYIASNTNSRGFGTLTTAIDYDNVNNVGSLAQVQAFESAMTTELTTGTSHQRLIKPTVAPALYSGGSFTNFGISRMWVDGSNNTTPHYGLRTFFVNNGVAGLVVDINAVLTVGLRNNW